MDGMLKPISTKEELEEFEKQNEEAFEARLNELAEENRDVDKEQFEKEQQELEENDAFDHMERA